MKLFKNKKGFYLVSPFLGFMFFLITVAMASFFVSEDHQSIQTAQAGVTSKLAFMTYSMHADATDVFLQNYVQEILDTYDINRDGALKKKLQGNITQKLRDLASPYEELYLNEGVTCETTHQLFSGVYITFTSSSFPVVENSPGVPCPGPFCLNEKTAAWPMLSKYMLNCTMEEPPIKSVIPIDGRWYYLDGKCICCQYPRACNDSLPPQPVIPFDYCRDTIGACIDPPI